MADEPKTHLEDALYAAAFVAEFDRLHALGVDDNFRRRVGKKGFSISEAVAAWEAWCADQARHAGLTAAVVSW